MHPSTKSKDVVIISSSSQNVNTPNCLIESIEQIQIKVRQTYMYLLLTHCTSLLDPCTFQHLDTLSLVWILKEVPQK
jgi:hypothetical protein